MPSLTSVRSGGPAKRFTRKSSRRSPVRSAAWGPITSHAAVHARAAAPYAPIPHSTQRPRFRSPYAARSFSNSILARARGAIPAESYRVPRNKTYAVLARTVSTA